MGGICGISNPGVVALTVERGDVVLGNRTPVDGSGLLGKEIDGAANGSRPPFRSGSASLCPDAFLFIVVPRNGPRISDRGLSVIFATNHAALGKFCPPK